MPVKDELGRTGSGVYEKPFIVAPGGERFSLFTYDANWRRVPNINVPANSVGVLPIVGPITKYSGDCGEPGGMDHANFINIFASIQNVNSLVLILDTPGGEARAAHDPVAALKSFNKPVLSYVHGMSASLGQWYTAATKEVYLSNELDQVGSIGSYCTFFDFKGYLEQNGIVMHEIYAPQSTDKNKDYRDALEGDYKAIENDLKIHVDKFIEFVAARNDRALQHKDKWSSGKMFYADEAIKYGLADGVMSLDKVISKAAWLGRRNK